MKRELKGMVVAITGASAGIGRALAERLARDGASLALCARRMEKLEELKRELPAEHLLVSADVSKSSDMIGFVAATRERFGRIDTLVCNAGYGSYRRTWELDEDE